LIKLAIEVAFKYEMTKKIHLINIYFFKLWL